jgi:anaerobic magnesium-protoporphyrin IX monomethyl ester cyclase
VTRPLITLIRPPAIEAFRFTTTSITPPLGLAYIAAALEKASYPVRVIDAVAEAPTTHVRYFRGYCVGLRLEDIVDRIPAESDIVGISVIFTHEWPVVARLARLIKDRFPEKRVILGGEHVTSLPEFCMLTSPADFLVVGEGEEGVVELLGALETGRPLAEVPGIVYRDGGDVIVNSRRNRATDIDSIPWPAWHLFRLDVYHRHRFVGGMYSPHLTVPILATRGCPYQCTYCSAPNMWTPRWIPRNPKLLVDEIEQYVNAYGARNFPFQDLTAVIQKKWTVDFCREILDRGLEITWQFPTGTRSEAIDLEVARLMKQSGMISMAYAPESGSETTRQLIKKKMKTENLFASIDAAAAADLNVIAYLVIGFPHDRPEHLAENLPFIDRLVTRGVRDLAIGFYMALPGTELFHSLYDSGRVRLDRAYFTHILDAQAIAPSQSYCDLSRSRLFLWKWRMFFCFYGAKNRAKDENRLLASALRMISGLFGSDGHESKLQTAAWNGIHSLWTTALCHLGPRWLPLAEEKALFADWDDVYRAIRRNRIAQGRSQGAPADSTELHRSNVIAKLAHEHQGVRLSEAAG